MIPAGENNILVQSFLPIELCNLQACAKYGGQGRDQGDLPAAITQVSSTRYDQSPVADKKYGAGLGILSKVCKQI